MTAKQKKASPPPTAEKRSIKVRKIRADNSEARKAQKEVERARRRDEWRANQAESIRVVRNDIDEYVKDWPRKSAIIGKASEPFMLKKWVAGTVGAPSVKYTQELGSVIEDLIVHGITLDTISTLQGMPGLGVLSTWLADATHPFASGYLRAKQAMVPFLEERALQLALRPAPGETRTTKSSAEFGDSEEVRTSDNVQRSALAFNAYQWTLAHLIPRKHGKQPDQSGGGKNEQLEALFQSLKSGPVE